MIQSLYPNDRTFIEALQASPLKGFLPMARRALMPKIGQEVEFKILPDGEYERGIVIETFSAQFMVRQWDEWEKMVLLTGDWHYAPSQP